MSVNRYNAFMIHVHIKTTTTLPNVCLGKNLLQDLHLLHFVNFPVIIGPSAGANVT